MECKYKKVTALIRDSRLEKVEEALRAIPVGGISVARVKGYGEQKNFFSNHWKAPQARIEIFARAEEVEKIVEVILETASTGEPGDGIVMVLPVENVWRIRDGSELQPTTA